MGETWPTLLIAFIPVVLAALMLLGWQAFISEFSKRRNRN